MNDLAETPEPVDLRLYTLAVEMADRISARRLTANAFYLTLETALVAFLGSAFATSGPTNFGKLLTLSVVGVAVSAVWWLSLRSYRDLNRAKYSVIQEMEATMPTQLFTREWQILKADPIEKWRPRYAELGTAERLVPGLFAATYVALAIAGVVWK